MLSRHARPRGPGVAVNPLSLWSVSNGVGQRAVDIIETEIPAKMLQVKLLSGYPRPRDQRSSPARFSGFILEAVGATLSQPWPSDLSFMPQLPDPETSEPPGDEVIDQALALGQATPERDSSSERSEFSQRLASFGLGESPDPLLKPAKPPQGTRKPRRL
jgi:hypothetical protein